MLYQLIIGTPTVMAIWLSLVAAATAAFCVLAAPAIRQRRAAARRTRQLAMARRAQLWSRVADLDRYAGELAVAALRSAVTAERRRSQWLTAHRMTESVWRAYDQASLASGAALAATAYQLPAELPLTHQERAARERYLMRAAARAHRRGELSGRQYAQVLLGGGRWDPARHPADIETQLRCAASRRLLSAYRTAADFERAAWRDATIAAAASDSLRQEARIAAAKAERARLALTSTTRRGLAPYSPSAVPLNLAGSGFSIGSL